MFGGPLRASDLVGRGLRQPDGGLGGFAADFDHGSRPVATLGDVYFDDPASGQSSRWRASTRRLKLRMELQT